MDTQWSSMCGLVYRGEKVRLLLPIAWIPAWGADSPLAFHTNPIASRDKRSLGYRGRQPGTRKFWRGAEYITVDCKDGVPGSNTG